MNKAIKAVIYARYSSSGQSEESIEGQLRECGEYAERNGLTVICHYVDRALSGTSDRRPEFQRLISDSARGQFEVVIVWKGDRFARNRYDSAVYKARLKKNGVRVVSAKEAMPEGPEGILFESMMEGWAEYYSADLSQKVKRGNYERALKRQTLGQSTFGLRKSADKTWELDPVTAPIVRRIFEEYAAGESTKSICARLNGEGWRTVRGSLFDKSNLRRILENEKYCGVYKHADIRDENGIPPIVSRELFDEVQKMIDRHHRSPAAKASPEGFLLTGKLFCGECGELMTGDGGTSKSGRVYNYYTCKGRRRKRCDMDRAPKELVEDAVVRALMDVVADDALCETIADRFMDWQDRQAAEDGTLRALETQLRQTETAIANLISMLEQGIVTESIKSRLLELEAAKADLAVGIANAKIKAPRVERSDVIWFIKSFRDLDRTDAGWKISLVDTFLKAAYLYRDGRLLLNLNFSGEESAVSSQICEDAVQNGELLCSNFDAVAAPDESKLNTVFFLGGVFVVRSMIRR